MDKIENKIILVGKLVPENADEILEGFAQVEFDVEELLNEIDFSDFKKYANDKYDLVDSDDLSEADEEDLVQELESRSYNFIEGVSLEALIDEVENNDYKCLDKYDNEYHSYVKISSLDIQDTHMFKEITDKFINSSIFEREEMYNAIMKIGR